MHGNNQPFVAPPSPLFSRLLSLRGSLPNALCSHPPSYSLVAVLLRPRHLYEILNGCRSSSLGFAPSVSVPNQPVLPRHDLGWSGTHSTSIDLLLHPPVVWLYLSLTPLFCSWYFQSLSLAQSHRPSFCLCLLSFLCFSLHETDLLILTSVLHRNVSESVSIPLSTRHRSPNCVKPALYRAKPFPLSKH